MNFPHATEEQISTARRIVARFCAIHGMGWHDAEDAAQDVLAQCMTRQYRRVCPADIVVAARWRIANARRYGVQTLRTGDSTARSRHAAAVKRGEPLPTRETAPASANPARVAEQVEGMSFARRRLAERLGITPAALALQAMGFGPLDEEDAAKASPAVPCHGPGYTPPAKGCPGMATDSDPNREQSQALRTAPPVALEGDNLAAYRAELARYYRGK